MANPDRNRSSRRSGEPTHLVGRSRGDKFNRAGLRFRSSWSAHELSSLTPEQIERLRGEAQLEVRIVDAHEARELTELPPVDGKLAASKAGLIEEIRRLTEENSDLRRQIEQLELAARGDKPPKPGDTAVGASTNPLPVPSGAQRSGEKPPAQS